MPGFFVLSVPFRGLSSRRSAPSAFRRIPFRRTRHTKRRRRSRTYRRRSPPYRQGSPALWRNRSLLIRTRKRPKASAPKTAPSQPKPASSSSCPPLIVFPSRRSLGASGLSASGPSLLYGSRIPCPPALLPGGQNRNTRFYCRKKREINGAVTGCGERFSTRTRRPAFRRPLHNRRGSGAANRKSPFSARQTAKGPT